MSPPPPTRILIVRVGAMGDILHALPAVTALRRALPHAHLGWAVEPRWRDLLDPTLIDEIHEIPTHAWKQKPVSFRTLRQILALRHDFRAAQYDLAVDLQGSLRSAFLARLSGAPRVAGPADPREAPARTFYTQRIALQASHVIARAAELLGRATGLALIPERPFIPQNAADETPSGFVLIAPTAGWGAKQWPIAAWQELVERLQASGYRVLINAPHDRDAIAIAIASGTQAEIRPTTVSGLVSLTRGATLVIGGDTGPVHLAAALGIRTLALFGPTDPARNGPHFPAARTIVLRHGTSVTDHRRHAPTERGLAQVSVDEVFAAALKLLANS